MFQWLCGLDVLTPVERAPFPAELLPVLARTAMSLVQRPGIPPHLRQRGMFSVPVGTILGSAGFDVAVEGFERWHALIHVLPLRNPSDVKFCPQLAHFTRLPHPRRHLPHKHHLSLLCDVLLGCLKKSLCHLLKQPLPLYLGLFPLLPGVGVLCPADFALWARGSGVDAGVAGNGLLDGVFAVGGPFPLVPHQSRLANQTLHLPSIFACVEGQLAAERHVSYTRIVLVVGCIPAP